MTGTGFEAVSNPQVENSVSPPSDTGTILIGDYVVTYDTNYGGYTVVDPTGDMIGAFSGRKDAVGHAQALAFGLAAIYHDEGYDVVVSCGTCGYVGEPETVGDGQRLAQAHNVASHGMAGVAAEVQPFDETDDYDGPNTDLPQCENPAVTVETPLGDATFRTRSEALRFMVRHGGTVR